MPDEKKSEPVVAATVTPPATQQASKGAAASAATVSKTPVATAVKQVEPKAEELPKPDNIEISTKPSGPDANTIVVTRDPDTKKWTARLGGPGSKIVSTRDRADEAIHDVADQADWERWPFDAEWQPE